MTVENSVNAYNHQQTPNLKLTIILVTKQHQIVHSSYQQNVVTCSAYPEKFIRDAVNAPFC